MLVSYNMTNYPDIICQNRKNRIESIYNKKLWDDSDYILTGITNIIVIHVLDIDDLIENIKNLDSDKINRILIPYDQTHLKKIRQAFPAGIELGYWGITTEIYQNIQADKEKPDIICSTMELPPADNIIACDGIDICPYPEALWIMRLNSIDHRRMILLDIRYIIRDNHNVITV